MLNGKSLRGDAFVPIPFKKTIEYPEGESNAKRDKDYVSKRHVRTVTLRFFSMGIREFAVHLPMYHLCPYRWSQIRADRLTGVFVPCNNYTRVLVTYVPPGVRVGVIAVLRRGGGRRYARGAVSAHRRRVSRDIYTHLRLPREELPNADSGHGEGAHEAKRGDEPVYRGTAVLDKVNRSSAGSVHSDRSSLTLHPLVSRCMGLGPPCVWRAFLYILSLE